MPDPSGFHGERQGGKQRNPEAADHHLNQGVQAAGAKAAALVQATGLADLKSLVSQAGALFRLFDAGQRPRLCANIVAAMQGVPRAISDRHLAHFDKADPAYGAGVRTALDFTRSEATGAGRGEGSWRKAVRIHCSRLCPLSPGGRGERGKAERFIPRLGFTGTECSSL